MIPDTLLVYTSTVIPDTPVVQMSLLHTMLSSHSYTFLTPNTYLVNMNSFTFNSSVGPLSIFTPNSPYKYLQPNTSVVSMSGTELSSLQLVTRILFMFTWIKEVDKL